MDNIKVGQVYAIFWGNKHWIERRISHIRDQRCIYIETIQGKPTGFMNMGSFLKMLDHGQCRLISTPTTDINLNLVGVTQSIDVPLTTEQLCTHEFRKYVGLTEVFDYCVFCDLKRKA